MPPRPRRRYGKGRRTTEETPPPTDGQITGSNTTKGAPYLGRTSLLCDDYVTIVMPRRLPPTGRATPCPAIAPAVISPAATDRTAAPPVRGLRRLRDREPPVLKLIAEIETEQRIKRLFTIALHYIDRPLLVTDIESEVPEIVADTERYAKIVCIAIPLII